MWPEYATRSDPLAEVMMSRMNEANYADMAELGSLYPAHVDTIKSRHDQALERAGASHAVIFSGAPRVAFLDDNVYPFIANPHFVGWLPLTNTPHCYLVLPGEGLLAYTAIRSHRLLDGAIRYTRGALARRCRPTPAGESRQVHPDWRHTQSSAVLGHRSQQSVHCCQQSALRTWGENGV